MSRIASAGTTSPSTARLSYEASPRCSDGQRRHRAAGAEQARRRMAMPLRQVAAKLAKLSAATRVAHAADRRRDASSGLAARRAPRSPSGRRRPRARCTRRDDLRLGPAVVDQDQFGRAAADVEDQRRPVALLQQRLAAEHGQPRLLRAAR